jgi:hypothetical protein
LNKLAWYEQTNDVRIAIEKEKQIRKWKRKWKLELIGEKSPKWVDLFYEIGGKEEMLKPDFNILKLEFTMKSDLIFKFLDSRSRLHENYSILKEFNCRRAGMTNLCFYIVTVSLKKVFVLKFN